MAWQFQSPQWPSGPILPEQTPLLKITLRLLNPLLHSLDRAQTTFPQANSLKTEANVSIQLRSGVSVAVNKAFNLLQFLAPLQSTQPAIG